MFQIFYVMGARLISKVPPVAWLLSHLDQGICLYLDFNANNILLSVNVNSSIIVLVSTLGIVGISPGSSVVNTLAK